jgi:hypothetical protein
MTKESCVTKGEELGASARRAPAPYKKCVTIRGREAVKYDEVKLCTRGEGLGASARRAHAPQKNYAMLRARGCFATK